jgi:hypothetical protein
MLFHLVTPSTSRRIKGATATTTGSMVSQETAHDLSQWDANVFSVKKGALAMAAAMKQVNPDWMMPKTKWP